MRVDIWSDIACPWCRIGKARFDTALAGFAHRDDVDVVWHSYVLDPDLPERFEGNEIDYLSERKGMPREQVLAMTSHVAEQGAGEGLHFDFAAVVPASSLKAHALLKFAEAKGADVGALEDALFEAHFSAGEVISDEDFLAATGAAVGLDADEVRTALTDPTVARAVQADRDAAAQMGISGVPFFVLDQQYGISGAQPSELFSQALEQVWQENHAGPKLKTFAGQQDAQACGPDGCAVPGSD
nr:DsbA family oxidoreductase [Brevibacterium daeguense]